MRESRLNGLIANDALDTLQLELGILHSNNICWSIYGSKVEGLMLMRCIILILHIITTQVANQTCISNCDILLST